jgi:hypothetical protein
VFESGGAQRRTTVVGRLHGDGVVDISFPTKVRNELVAAGQAVPHHVSPKSGKGQFLHSAAGGHGESDRATAALL